MADDVIELEPNVLENDLLDQVHKTLGNVKLTETQRARRNILKTISLSQFGFIVFKVIFFFAFYLIIY